MTQEPNCKIHSNFVAELKQIFLKGDCLIILKMILGIIVTNHNNDSYCFCVISCKDKTEN